ncbi:rhamnan synthesis F family protein [Nioella aestuarii]|uniref:rhamnan synthesis F family protein n=1 Tax=Nioella aestuarii TaxID=1662864 RepID=UPI003D7FEF2B
MSISSKMWKLRREIARFGKQIGSPTRLLGGHLRRMRHDANPDNVTVSEGALEFGQDVAIVLIYQPDGLLPSLQLTLDHLIENGVTPVVVSNHPVSASDRALLNGRCALIVERPNIGYDFGGYRDGILTLKRLGVQVERLIVMNDSTWIPIRPESRFIETALNAPEDVYGIFFNTKNKKVSHRHLQSYFYRFGPAILRDERFWDFWRRMPLYGQKWLVVRRLEVRVSGTMSALGYSIGSFINPDDILAALEKLSDSEVLDVARYHSENTERGRSIFGDVLAAGGDDSDLTAKLREKMRNSRMRFYFIDAHPRVFLGMLNSPFIKKSREPHYAAQRELIRTGGYLETIDPIIRAEIETWDSNLSGR